MAIVKTTVSINAGQDIPRALNFSRTSSASRVNSIGRVETVAAGQIRLDYDPTVVGQQRGWLLEETSTNVLKDSADFGSTWATSGVGTVQVNQTKSPDGSNNTLSGDLLKASASGASQNVAVVQSGLTFTSGNKYTVSVWAKKKELDYLEISDKLDGTDVTYAKTFKLSDGTIGNGTSDDATIEQYVNGWYRCTVTFTATGTTGGSVFLKARSDNLVSSTCNIAIANDSISLWGAQVEALPYATSYIPTTTATVTRAADVAFLQETNPTWNWDVGASLLIHAAPLHTSGTNNPIYHYQDSGNNNFISYLNTGDIKIFAAGNSQLDTAGPDHVFDTGFDNTAKAHFCNMIAIKKDRVHMGHNGALSPNLPDTSVTVPMNGDSSVYTIKFFHGQGMNSSSGWLKRFDIWSNVVSDASLQNDTINGTISPDIAVQYQPIQALSVTTGKIAADAVTGDKIADNSIGTEHLKVDIIVAEDIASNAIGIAEIQNNAVTSDKIADNAVNGAKIALTNDAAGDIMYYNGTNYVRLPKGTNGHVLTLDTGLPAWTQDSTDVAGATIGGVSGDLSGTVATATINNGAVTNGKLGADAVDGTKLQDNAVNSEHYTDLSILTAHIGNSQITGGKILTATITGDKILSDASNDVNRSITTNHIKDANITRAKLQSDIIDGTKLADDVVNSEHYVDGSIDTAHIADLQVTSGKLADDSVISAKIANLNITEGKIAAGAVTNGKLGADAVDGTKLQDNAVNSEHYVDGSIDTVHIADLQVTAGKIANDTITATQIANTTITSSQLAANSVTTAKVADNQITIGKLALTDGTAGQVLKTDGNGVMSFQDDTDTTIGNAALTGDVTGTLNANTVNWNLIPNNTITTAMIAADVIVAEDVANNAITIAELNINSVNLSKLVITGSAPSAGQILSHDGSGNFTWVDDTDTTIGDAAVSGMVSGTISNISISAGVVTPTMLSATGTANNTTFLRGDGVWAAPAMTETDPTAVTMAIALG